MKPAEQRYHRPDFVREIKVYLNEHEALLGFTRDLSEKGASIFIQLQDSIEDKSASVFYDWRSKLLHEIVYLSVKPWQEQELFPLKVLRVDSSWQKGYDIFLAGEFIALAPELQSKLKDLCPTPIVREAPHKNYISQKLAQFKVDLASHHSEAIDLEMQSSYTNVCATRDFLASIAQRHNFSEQQTYYIKLMSDELLMNAFLYGTPPHGYPKTKVHVQISREGLLLEVTDMGGRQFNEMPYREKSLGKSSGGLAMVHAFSEDWQVKTKPGKSTTTSFFILRHS